MSEPLTLDELRDLHDSLIWRGMPASQQEFDILRSCVRELIAIREARPTRDKVLAEIVEICSFLIVSRSPTTDADYARLRQAALAARSFIRNYVSSSADAVPVLNELDAALAEGK